MSLFAGACSVSEVAEIQELCQEVTAQLLLLDRARRVRTFRGARARQGLKTQVRRLENRLGADWQKLRNQIVRSLRGPSDDLASGRLHQDQRLDRDRLAAILVLLAIWQRDYLKTLAGATGVYFGLGRNQILTQLKQPKLTPSNETKRLISDVEGLYRNDVSALQQALENGSVRASGLRQIIQESDTVEQAIPQVDQLFRSERFRLDLLAESFVWTAWSQGFRAGAVEGSQALEASGEPVPSFRWSGPADSVTCSPCLAQFGRDVQATSFGVLPLPQEICSYGRNCRHFWSLISND